jgi:hypothetical protein
MRKLVAMAMLFLSVKSSLAQRIHPQNKQEIIAICDKFMDAFKDGKFTDAYEYLKQYSVISDNTLDTLAAYSKDRMNSLREPFGKSLSFEQISERPVKNSLINLIYILKFERSFLKFRFILYNNGSGWTISTFDYSDQVDDLFDAATK